MTQIAVVFFAELSCTDPRKLSFVLHIVDVVAPNEIVAFDAVTGLLIRNLSQYYTILKPSGAQCSCALANINN